MNPPKRMTAKRYWFIIFCLGISILSAGENLPDYRGQVFSQINALREKRRLQPLAGREDLHKIAAAYARELAERGVLSHFGRNGEALDKRLNAAGCTDWKAAGENLARSTFAGFTVSDIVKSWTLSAGHYKNIITPGFKFTGIGWALDARQERIYFVQIFAE